MSNLRPQEQLRKVKPLVDNVVRLLDEDGRECPAGEAGELLCSSPKLLSGHWRNPVATHEVYRHFDGISWVSAGDMAKGDHKGYRHIVGRTSSRAARQALPMRWVKTQGDWRRQS